MKSIKLWGLQEHNHLFLVGLMTRDDIRMWAAKRMMAGSLFGSISMVYAGHEKAMKLWAEVLRGHPTIKIVRLVANTGVRNHGN